LTLQIEFADVILLNKVDTVSAEEVPRLRSILAALNPGALILPTVNSEVDLKHVINTGACGQHACAEGGLRQLHVNERVEHVKSIQKPTAACYLRTCKSTRKLEHGTYAHP
jgi:G3E family GTPase